MDASTEYTDKDGDERCTDILIIGKTGNGKSSTANSILGRRVFESLSSPTSVTKKVQMDYTDVCGRIVKVVDGPGVYDTDLSQPDALELVESAMQYAVASNPRGYHAILLVVRYGVRYTKEEHKAVDVLKGIFGSDFVEKFTILVVTYGDMFNPEESNVRTFEEWCLIQQGAFRELLGECKNRVILFDNKTKDMAKLADQRQRLLTMVDSLSQHGERYSNKHFLMAKKERDRLFVEAKHPVIREVSLMEASLIIQQLGKIQLDKPEQQLDKLQELKRRAEQLIQGIMDQDRGTGVLRAVLNNARHISSSVDEHIENTKKAVAMQKETRQNMEQLEKAKEVYKQQAREEAQQEAQQQIEELQRQNEERQARYEELAEQLRQTNMRVETEYRDVVRQQNENILPMIVRAILDFIPHAVRLLFRR